MSGRFVSPSALRLADEGWRVFGGSRRDSTVADRVHGLKLDVTDDESVARAVDQVLEAEGRIDLHVNNAGFALSTVMPGSAGGGTRRTDASRQLSLP
ncbi:MAG TPA: SDR family oxidoreductase [Allosphingosinicella sp.]|nr:SDR family oxidoreductase [Allosphingosinicella sp.]